jgi:hypothetical protein
VRNILKRRKPDLAAVDRIFTGSCRVREHTGDGGYVGACEFATYDGFCPRHGDVLAYLDGRSPWPADFELPKYDGSPWAEGLRRERRA